MSFNFWKRLAAIGAGLVTLSVVTNLIDYVAYPLMVAFLGPFKGGGVMTVFWLITNYFLIRLYNRTSQDWFGFEWLRLQEDLVSNTRWNRFLRYLLRHWRWLFVALLSWQDPMKAFVFVKGRRPAGTPFTASDWRVFLGLNLAGNLVWILALSGLFEIVKQAIF